MNEYINSKSKNKKCISIGNFDRFHLNKNTNLYGSTTLHVPTKVLQTSLRSLTYPTQVRSKCIPNSLPTFIILSIVHGKRSLDTAVVPVFFVGQYLTALYEKIVQQTTSNDHERESLDTLLLPFLRQQLPSFLDLQESRPYQFHPSTMHVVKHSFRTTQLPVFLLVKRRQQPRQKRVTRIPQNILRNRIIGI
ncbi:hypothetical protein MIMGU_mgv1a014377mg [Erythranthe guttata]|uniref:Uncharacterized protein n=1 Tax=Erythranthe guttata TaxID=4155 RepID=A0A022REX2_ERYGU|nr:hypothetical protein MIMGU_mgv1a014377mg [Erythranthe guttata]